MFTDAKKSTFKTEVQTIFKQAQTDFINDSINNLSNHDLIKLLLPV